MAANPKDLHGQQACAWINERKSAPISVARAAPPNPARIGDGAGNVLPAKALCRVGDTQLWSTREPYGADTILGNARIHRHAGAGYASVRRQHVLCRGALGPRDSSRHRLRNRRALARAETDG